MRYKKSFCRNCKGQITRGLTDGYNAGNDRQIEIKSFGKLLYTINTHVLAPSLRERIVAPTYIYLIKLFRKLIRIRVLSKQGSNMPNGHLTVNWDAMFRKEMS